MPFSKKQQCFRRLEELDIPFIAIAPWGTVMSKYIRDLFGDSMQYLIPRRRLKMSKDFYTLAIDITGGWALGCGGSCGVAVAVGCEMGCGVS